MIVGLDTASNRVHWVGNAPMEKMAAKDWYGWASCKDPNADIRRAVLFNYMVQLTAALPPGSHVFCEEPLSLQNGKTTRLLGLAAGALWGAFYSVNPDATWHWVDVAHWKKTVVGKGNANKDDIQEHVKALIEMNDPIATEDFDNEPDLSDAYCLMVYGREML